MDWNCIDAILPPDGSKCSFRCDGGVIESGRMTGRGIVFSASSGKEFKPSDVGYIVTHWKSE